MAWTRAAKTATLVQFPDVDIDAVRRRIGLAKCRPGIVALRCVEPPAGLEAATC